MDMAPSMGDGTCDYDKDGINDDLDSDSDNDGCPDTKEAVHGKAFATNKNYVKGPYGANGFSSLLETNDLFTATYKSTGWLPKVTTSPKKDYVNELINTRCIVPFIVPAGPTEFCDPGQVVLNINLNGGIVPASYQWLKDDVVISGATSSSYIATETGDFTCTLTYADGSTVTTDPQDVTENPLPAIPTVTGYTGPVCIGTPIILTSSYATYNQWYATNKLVAGATATTYSVTASGDYKVEYTDPVTGCKSYSITTVVVIGATPATPIVTITQPTCLTAAGAITVTPSGNAGDTYSLDGITYQSSYVFNNKAPGTYTVFVKNSAGCTSAATTAIINAQPASPVTPTITAAPGTAICSGGATTLTSSASTGNQWIKDGTPIAGATNATYTAAFPGVYTLQVTNNSGCSTISEATTITVAPSPTSSLSQSLELGSTNCGTASPIKLTASTDATNPTYAWYLDGVLIGGATASTYTAVATGNYTVKITNATGCSTTSAPSSVTTGPSASAGSPASICLGQTFTFVASTSGLTNTTYAWEYRATSAGTWATATAPRNNSSYLANTSGEYRVIVKGVDGSNNSQTINSCPTSLAVNALPTVSIGANPTGALCAGQTTVLTATANHSSAATIATYQWIDGTTNIS